ncbi:MAG: TIGR03761 family integrating conjugative element protein [Burkholderiales bacterium]|jgi:integrating conjugative element protein (TIGR03761 family)|nr:TIGR03761 family integrating conjugative element protein [Burkholderiales bacterium]
MTAITKPSRRKPAAEPENADTPTVASLTSSLQSIGVPGPLAMGGVSIDFIREAASPFLDGYSITGERTALAELLAADEPDESDPLYPRLLLLDERERELRDMETRWKSRNGADEVVKIDEARSMRQLGSLVTEGEDSMTLHTKEGYRLFVGRAKDPQGAYPAIVGGKRIASALRSLWMLTSLDNPYADWALVHHEHTLSLMKDLIEKEIKKGKEELESMRARGLSYGLLVSAEPKSLELGFKSPYGYAIAELMVSYDYFIRLVKTLGRKNLISDDQERIRIREVTRVIRRHFGETARFERWLMRPELRELARADFMPGVVAEGAKRVTAAAGIFGPIPADIFSGRMAPRHSRRRLQLTEQDKKMLLQVSAELAKAEAAGIAESAASAEAVEAEAAQLV